MPGPQERSPARLNQSGGSENAQTLDLTRKSSSRTDEVRSGSALDPQSQALLDLIRESGRPHLYEVSVEEARAMYRKSSALLNPGEPPAVGGTRDIEIPGPAGPIRARLYLPAGVETPAVTVFFHGGGWVIGDLESHDVACRTLCLESAAAVIAVDYRLAPGHPFPAAVEDCWAATAYIAANGAALGVDASRMAVAGDSAGGNLAAVITQRARKAGGPALRCQVLIYPAVDAHMASPSHEELADGYVLTRRLMDWFYGHYAVEPQHPEASPILTPDLRGLPPALIVVAGFDPLRDEGEDYGRKLTEQGNQVEVVRYDGMMHGFITAPGFFDDARAALSLIGERVRRHLG